MTVAKAAGEAQRLLTLRRNATVRGDALPRERSAITPVNCFACKDANILVARKSPDVLGLAGDVSSG